MTATIEEYDLDVIRYPVYGGDDVPDGYGAWTIDDLRRADDESAEERWANWLGRSIGEHLDSASKARAIRRGDAPWCVCGATAGRRGHSSSCPTVRPAPDAVFAEVGITDAPKPLTEDEAGARCERYLTVSQLRDLPGMAWLVEGLVPMRSLGYITGRDATWKTFVTLSLCLAVVTYTRWHGREVDFDGCGRALYLAGEGVPGFWRRIEAWCEHHGVELAPWQEQNLVVRNGTVDLFAGAADFAELLAFVADFQPDLVVIDTLNCSAGGAEQNSASDMSVITARLSALKEAAPHATVAVVAHTTKADDDARGSSAIEDDADWVLHCKKTDDDRMRVKVAKMKDGEDGQEIPLRAVPVADSIVLVPAGPEPQWLSDNVAARVLGVLFINRDGDDLTASQVLALVRDDGTDKLASRTQVYDALGELKREGKVVGEKRGQATRYRLHPSALPKDVQA